MLPYLYTANVNTAKQGIPLICPLYYYSKDKRAYSRRYRNQYFFGEQLLVAPITRKSRGGVSQIKVWLPDGEWINFFTGERYLGGKEYMMSCTLDTFPVFAKKGAIIPLLEDRDGNSQVFDRLDIRIFEGDNHFVMHDEKGDIIFDMKASDDTIILDIDIDGEIPTVNLNLIFEGIESASTWLDGKNIEFSALSRVDCKHHHIELCDIKRA